jgi:pimeloyl-ACP methyl ester carboxylesterase
VLAGVADTAHGYQASAMTITDSLPVLLIPGLADSPRLYQAQLPRLFQKGPVMVADHTRDDTIAAIATRVLAHAPPRFALVGLSLGGYTALEIMRRAPERVAGLAVLDSSARPDTAESSERRRVAMAATERGEYRAVTEAQWPNLVHPAHAENLALKNAYVEMHMAVGAEAFVRQQRAIISRPDSRPSLAAIKCPTLVLVGDADKVTPKEVAEELAAGIAGARLCVIESCGHLSALEQPEAVGDALLTWLDSFCSRADPRASTV